VIAPILGGHASETALATIEDEVSVEMTLESNDIATATVNYSTMTEGEKVSEVITFEGTKAEVENKLKAFEESLTNEDGEVEKVIERINITKGS
jgi:K(+)-stimulated pyrophosphate-energized sodium pump